MAPIKEVSEVYIKKSHFINYRYKCEHCGKESGWQRKEIEGVGSRSFIDIDWEKGKEGQVISNKQHKQLEKESCEELEMKMHYLFRASKNNNYSGFEGICPHCKKKQTWSLKSFFDNFFEGLGLSLACGFFTYVIIVMIRFIMYLGNEDVVIFNMMSWKISLIVFGIFSFIFLITSIFSHIENKKLKKEVVNKEILEIHWNWDFSVSGGW